MDFLHAHGADLLVKVGEHLYISVVALLLGIVVAVPLGILVTRYRKLSGWVMGTASILQTIPSLALLAIMISVLGVGKPPAIAALFIYSLLPILRNTVLAIDQLDPGLIDAAKGMGMTGRQRLVQVELPLGMPVMMAGIRLSGVYVIAWATLASYIGAGGLGDYIFTGLNNYNPQMIVAGTLPVTLLALMMDMVWGILERRLTPRTRGEEQPA